MVHSASETQGAQCVSSHCFSFTRAVTWVLKASSERDDSVSPKEDRNSSIFSSTSSVLRRERDLNSSCSSHLPLLLLLSLLSLDR
ncbi:hypothetical protein EYF80_049834 [Liparis tanakae]|uniref:Uncharacterized protein n=1 Tax=Liparis tanakae TaxID=230148 RepID=A0A4Z2FGI1_9TELE|nr:hypothetical protein EYF80_049834 [Liparis tanakae]